MKLFRFSNSLFYTGVVILLSSCGSGSNEKTTATDTTAANDSAAKAQVVNTIITTPQNMVVVTHKVANYAKWLVAYEAHDSARLASGLHSYVIGRGLEDSNMVMVALKVDDTAKAKAFEKSPGLKQAMQKAGVLGAPTISLTTNTWQDTATIGPVIRSMTSMTVKDWDAFVKGFEDGKQIRTDNGIMDRVVGHDLNDNKKVFVVTALTDTAKAFAYYKSDELKKRRAAAGVIGEPTRFLFRIAKKY
ncbi:MAG: hypothetical protein BGO55_24195 [Sphingobacteriales bacterium 50-39]|nr:hypothetical protein [Sphingobacteriales bacterium]OJW58397.1 MAG: hypothetical protein BGO55_24195 [Sphingobacteriales bacterium 50-39]